MIVAALIRVSQQRGLYPSCASLTGSASPCGILFLTPEFLARDNPGTMIAAIIMERVPELFSLFRDRGRPFAAPRIHFIGIFWFVGFPCRIFGHEQHSIDGGGDITAKDGLRF